jgi:hypothetical protein
MRASGAFLACGWGWSVATVVEGEREAHGQTGSKSDPIHLSVQTIQVWARPLKGSRQVPVQSKI